MTAAPASARAHFWAGQLLVLLVTGVYAFTTGPVVFFWDCHSIADRAKHIAHDGTLDMNNRTGSVAGPLYSVLISPAYLTSDPVATQRAILAINTLLYALCYAPLFLLLRDYSRLTPRAAAGWAILVALAPATLPYAAMVFTEMAYFPLVYLSAWLLARTDERRGWLAPLALGLSLAAAMLARNAAAALILALLAVALLRLLAALSQRSGAGRCILAYALALAALVGPLALWRMVEANLKFSRGGFDYARTLNAIISDPAAFDLHAGWLANCLVYLLAAPLCAAGVFVLVLVVTRPRMLLDDGVATYSLLGMLISAMLAVVLMESFWGGKELTWNRYVVPCAGLWLPIALRYRAQYDGRAFAAVLVGLPMLWLGGFPSRLDCHFPDSLALFSPAAKLSTAPGRLLDTSYLILVALTAAAPLSRWRAVRAAGLFGFSATCLVALLGSHQFWTHSAHNLRAYLQQNDGIAATLLRETTAQPAAVVFYDPDVGDRELLAVGRVLYLHPQTLTAMPVGEFWRRCVASQPTNVSYYITPKTLPAGELLAVDRDVMHLFRLRPGDGAAVPDLDAPAAQALLSASAPPLGFWTARETAAPFVRICGVRPGQSAFFERLPEGPAIWLGPREAGSLTLFVRSGDARTVTLGVKVGLMGAAVPASGACPLELRVWETVADRIDVHQPGVYRFSVALQRGLNLMTLQIPVDAGPGREHGDPRLMMLLLNGATIE